MSSLADKPFTGTLIENEGERTFEITINEEGFDSDQFERKLKGISSTISLINNKNSGESRWNWLLNDLI